MPETRELAQRAFVKIVGILLVALGIGVLYAASQTTGLEWRGLFYGLAVAFSVLGGLMLCTKARVEEA